MNYFSTVGKHHEYNQDFILFDKNRSYCAMTLADGVSTCSKSRKGAEAVCYAVTEYLLRHGKRFFAMDSQEAVNCLLEYILFKLRQITEQESSLIKEYSSTMACILVDRYRNQMLYFSIGDSLILATKEDRCSVVAMPSDSRNGCCVTTTFNASTMAKVGKIDTEHIQSIIICSDGAWHLMYNRNKLNPLVKEILINQDYDKLKNFLMKKDRFDDCSFISVNLKDCKRRKPS